MQAAEQDLRAVEAAPDAAALLDEVDELRQVMRRLQLADRMVDKSFCARLFR